MFAYPCAMPAELFGGGPADSRSSAGDENRFVFPIHGDPDTITKESHPYFTCTSDHDLTLDLRPLPEPLHFHYCRACVVPLLIDRWHHFSLPSLPLHTFIYISFVVDRYLRYYWD